MRISVSSWATTDEDLDRSLEAILSVANDSISREDSYGEQNSEPSAKQVDAARRTNDRLACFG